MYSNIVELFSRQKQGKQFLDSLPVAVYATDTEGQLTYFNSAAAELSGRDPEIGTDHWCVSWKLYSTDGTPMPHEECPMAVSLNEERQLEGEEAIIERPDGKQTWIKAYPSPLRNKKGTIIGGINVLVDITDQKKTENQLRRNEKELTDFFENASVGIRWVRPDGTIKRANNTELNMFGYSREEYVGRHVADFHADRDKIEDAIQKLSAGEDLKDFETRIKCKDGSTRHVVVNSNVYREDGEFIHTRCITRDITPRRLAESRLLDVTAESNRKERLYKAIISSTPDLVYVFDLDYRFIFANEALLEMWGLTREEAIGQNLRGVGYEPWHADMHRREIDQIVATKQPVQAEVSFPHNKFGKRYYDYIFVPVLDDKGEVEAVAGTTRDITDRKEAEQALRKSEEKYRTLFNKMDEGFCIIKVEFNENDEPVDFRYLEANPAYATHTGITGIEGKKASEVLSDSAPGLIQRHGNIALTGEPFHEEVYVEEIKRWLDLSAFRIGAPEERKVAVLFHNITERKQVQQELQAVNESLEERVEKRTESLLSYQSQLRSLASQLSMTEEKQRQQLATELHDNLGQLLAIGKMKIKELQKNQVPDHSPKVVTGLEEVIDDAIDYTRNLMTDLKPPPSISDDIRASVEWAGNKLAERGLTVSIKDDGRPKPLSKEVRITTLQCVRELLYNVLKHTSEKEAVITFNGGEDQLHISVEDEGPGFDVEHKDLSPDKDGKFGLFNVQERIDLLGGVVGINARRGKGTKVTISVPLREKIQATEMLKEATSPKGNITPEKKIKVLLVDDHQVMRKGLRKIIENQDDIMVIGEAATGEEAIELTRQSPPDIILMDINLPGIGGIEATRIITGERPDIRIIGLSLHNDKGVVEEIRNAGASAYLTKSDAFESLIVTIRAEAQKDNQTPE